MEIATTSAQVSDALFARYATLIYDRTGIRISPQKKMLLSNRLRRRLRETGIKDFEAYFTHLKSLKANHPEWDGFLQEITTHETYLFRDEAQWNWFRNVFLAEMAGAARAGQRSRSLRIWSAASSTGDEAFTIATCIAACLHGFQDWNIKIIGTDIGIGAIEQARSATFGERSMHLVPENYKRSFFRKLPDGDYQATPALVGLTQFKQHNLLEPLLEKPFDLIFVKNVLIYFDGPSKDRVLKHVRGLMAPTGYLVAGGAEGVADKLRDLERIEPWLYRNPTAKGASK